MYRLFAAFILLSLLGACATLTKNECTNADWFSIGYSDGANGKEAGYFARHVKACEKHGVTPQQSPWKEGREDGLRVFCVPEQAYRIGRRGGGFPAVCTPKETIAMRPAWDWGRNYYEYTKDIAEVDDYIDELEEALDAITDPDDKRLDTYPLFLTASELDKRSLERRRQKYEILPERLR